jgi:MarR family transcriptional regulator for hemolysin
METLDSVIFYTIERAIKKYRQFAQTNITAAGFDITIDQWLVLVTIANKGSITQSEIGEIVFKDQASVARIIELLVKKKYLSKTADVSDRRRSFWELTEEGKVLLVDLQEVINSNRSHALTGLADEDISQLRKSLEVIGQNCM